MLNDSNLFVGSNKYSLGYSAMMLVIPLLDLVPANTAASLSSEIQWLGIQLPHWIGWIFYALGLLFGALLSTYQETAVDKYIKNPKLKPIYSFGFGAYFTLFGLPLYYKDLTVWQLILPAVCSAAIGSQMIYYLISSAKYIWCMIMDKFGIKVPDGFGETEHGNNDGDEGNKK